MDAVRRAMAQSLTFYVKVSIRSPELGAERKEPYRIQNEIKSRLLAHRNGGWSWRGRMQI
jgi:hypothetical protein